MHLPPTAATTRALEQRKELGISVSEKGKGREAHFEVDFQNETWGG